MENTFDFVKNNNNLILSAVSKDDLLSLISNYISYMTLEENLNYDFSYLLNFELDNSSFKNKEKQIMMMLKLVLKQLNKMNVKYR